MSEHSPSNSSKQIDRAACLNCRKLQKRLDELQAVNDRLLRAVHREAEQWDKRAPNSGR